MPTVWFRASDIKRSGVVGPEWATKGFVVHCSIYMVLLQGTDSRENQA
jgi:hypothetical protein